MSRILVVDNYDSFVFNLVQYLAQLGAEVEVRRNDAVAADDPLLDQVDGVLLSPGPGRPEDAGVCVDLVRTVGERLPIFGVCLGHQAIAVAYGGSVDRAPELLHGKTSEVSHSGVGVLRGLPDPFIATRYHSLAAMVTDLPPVLEVTARTAGGVIMGLRHRDLPVEGVQFHPESVLTEGGHRMLANWLEVCGEPAALARVPELAAKLDRQRAAVALR
ncbi:MAG TPA: aminodeoxychorismate/anthranilate synthase component II [Mycobacteriales bacterium]|jgi:para-aminobenzoate synthetase component 2|nr:aminodeoxychorismate/anthranilate synthase component II [Mycobacteriales bacterium]